MLGSRSTVVNEESAPRHPCGQFGRDAMDVGVGRHPFGEQRIDGEFPFLRVHISNDSPKSGGVAVFSLGLLLRLERNRPSSILNRQGFDQGGRDDGNAIVCIMEIIMLHMRREAFRKDDSLLCLSANCRERIGFGLVFAPPSTRNRRGGVRGNRGDESCPRLVHGRNASQVMP